MTSDEPSGRAERGLVIAGYVLTVPAEAPPDLATVPSSILTVSECIMRTLPRPEFSSWFPDRDQAALARSKSAPEADVTPVVLRGGDAVALMNESHGPEDPAFSLLSRSIDFFGEVLGYELVGVDWNTYLHSWHCHGYADEASDVLGIRVDDRGLLSTYEEATGVLDWMLSLPPERAPAPAWWAVAALGAPADVDESSVWR